MTAEDKQARGNGKDKGFEVCERGVAGSADVDWREETEDIFGGIWELPKLANNQYCGSEWLMLSIVLQSNMDHLRECPSLPKGGRSLV